MGGDSGVHPWSPAYESPPLDERAGVGVVEGETLPTRCRDHPQEIRKLQNEKALPGFPGRALIQAITGKSYFFAVLATLVPSLYGLALESPGMYGVQRIPFDPQPTWYWLTAILLS